MTTPVALVTGATGQDGSYLLDRLLAEEYQVVALVRASDSAALAERTDAVTVIEADLCDRPALRRAVLETEPDEIYNLGGVSSVAQSWQEPELTAEVSGLSVLTLLQAAAELAHGRSPAVRFLQASSAEIFGEPESSPQTEATPVRPVNPYGAAKAFAQHCVAVARHQGMFAASTILFNHESPRRPTTFVTRKISRAVAQIARDGKGYLTLGNMTARRDWGWAPDYVDAMVRACRHSEPDDYVIATGESHSVEEFVASAFRAAGISDFHSYVGIDQGLLRPVDAQVLVGDAAHARSRLNWAPTTTFEQLVGEMVRADIEAG